MLENENDKHTESRDDEVNINSRPQFFITNISWMASAFLDSFDGCKGRRSVNFSFLGDLHPLRFLCTSVMNFISKREIKQKQNCKILPFLLKSFVPSYPIALALTAIFP